MRARRFEEFRVGMEHRSRRWIREADIDAFASLSGDVNPLHLDHCFARQFGFANRVAHGILTSAYLSSVLGTEFPGPGVLWLSQTIRFVEPAYEDDLLEFVIRVLQKSDGLRTMELAIEVVKFGGVKIMVGQAKVMLLEQASAVRWCETTAIVTGGSRGIGAGIARTLAARGARVVINYRSNEEAAMAVRDEIVGAGGRATIVAADITTPAGVELLVQEAFREFKTVHVLVNNASPSIESVPLAELTWEQVQNFINAYLKSAFLLTQALRPEFTRQRYGRIVNVLSSYVMGSPPAGMTAYVTAKSALAALAKCLSLELAPFGVTVNNVLPSPVITEQWASSPESRRRALAFKNPMKRVALVDDVANAVAHFASPESGFITGASLPVTGGEAV